MFKKGDRVLTKDNGVCTITGVIGASYPGGRSIYKVEPLDSVDSFEALIYSERELMETNQSSDV